ncbi:MAG: hypothetical protein K2Y22_12185 [Candidatus Obscuribacterales bacterium]|nr:hypothetical protein [Candidatus Obscuribacterales bacterium]
MEIFSQSLWHGQRLVATVLKAAVSRGKLAHAYLLSGRAREDKWQLSRQLACYLNCHAHDKEKLGSCAFRYGLFDTSGEDTHKLCQNCSWILKNEHPQAFVQLAGEDTKSGKIAVEKARILASELTKTSDYFRVVVIPDASEEILHRPAANALLKTIEEPPASTVFVLFADHFEDVLPTIVSRCQVLNLMNQPDSGTALGSLTLEQAQQMQKFIGALPINDPKSRRVWTGLNWAKSAQAISDEVELPLADIIDQVVAKEIETFKDAAIKMPAYASYLKSLLDLADKTKQQLDHYVSSKAASDYFALCLRKLRQDCFGSGVFGKS